MGDIVLNLRPKLEEKASWYVPFDAVISIDVGQKSDFTAISVVQQENDRFVLKALTRFRHLSYTEVVQRVLIILETLPKNTACVVDSTGVGTPVCDMLNAEGIQVWRITITGGYKANITGYNLNIPKEMLVNVAQVVVESGKLVIADGLSYWKEALNEFENFAMKVAPGGDQLTYSALRSGQKDDLVLSILMNLYFCDRYAPAQKTTNSQIHVESFRGAFMDFGLGSPDDGYDVLSDNGGYSPALPSNEEIRSRYW